MEVKEMTENKSAEEIITKARKINLEDDTQRAFELLMDWLSRSGSNYDLKEKIKVFDKAAEYLAQLRADALALREKADRLLAKGTIDSAFIEAQKSLDIFEKYDPKISAELTRDLIVKIKQKEKEEMQKMEKELR